MTSALPLKADMRRLGLAGVWQPAYEYDRSFVTRGLHAVAVREDPVLDLALASGPMPRQSVNWMRLASSSGPVCPVPDIEISFCGHLLQAGRLRRRAVRAVAFDEIVAG